MFTGIIKEVGQVKRIERVGVCRLTVSCAEVGRGAKIGDSIAVNGICLTVIDMQKDAITFDVMGETVRTTNIQNLATRDPVNLEDALKIGDHLGGHIVQGHIDCMGAITTLIKRPGDVSMEITIPPEDAHLVVEKGSVAIDGISLTVGPVTPTTFTVYLIPHTLTVTNLGRKKTGDTVNVEFDVVGKYIARSKELEKGGSAISEELLRRAKFI